MSTRNIQKVKSLVAVSAMFFDSKTTAMDLKFSTDSTPTSLETPIPLALKANFYNDHLGTKEYWWISNRNQLEVKQTRAEFYDLKMNYDFHYNKNHRDGTSTYHGPGRFDQQRTVSNVIEGSAFTLQGTTRTHHVTISESNPNHNLTGDIERNWIKSSRLAFGKSDSIYVNAASKYSVCGGAVSGGRHVLEEALCSMSNLEISLRDVQMKNWKLPYFDDRGIDAGEVILSENVTFNRNGTSSGYAFRKDSVLVTDIISLAMPNLNPSVKDSSLDRFKSDDDYKKAIKYKFVAMLNAASHVQGANRLVIPELGCNVFMNDPGVVGKILGEVLAKYTPSNIREIKLYGKTEFQKATEEAFKNFSPTQPQTQSQSHFRDAPDASEEVPAQQPLWSSFFGPWWCPFGSWNSCTWCTGANTTDEVAIPRYHDAVHPGASTHPGTSDASQQPDATYRSRSAMPWQEQPGSGMASSYPYSAGDPYSNPYSGGHQPYLKQGLKHPVTHSQETQPGMAKPPTAERPSRKQKNACPCGSLFSYIFGCGGSPVIEDD